MILHHLMHRCSYDHDVFYVPLLLLLACKILHCVQYVLRKSVSILEHKTFALAINRDYFGTVFTSDNPCTV